VELKEGSQVLLSGRAAVVIGVVPFAGCEVLTLFWPATTCPPEDMGRARPGTFQTKIIHLLKLRNGGPCLWDVGQPVRLALNTDPATFIQLGAWMEAFVGRCREGYA